MGEKLPRILSKVATSTSLFGSFTCRKFTTWDRRLYFPSEGRRAEDFFARKNPTASAGFEPANLGTKGQHATPKPPKGKYVKKNQFLPHRKHRVSITNMLTLNIPRGVL